MAFSRAHLVRGREWWIGYRYLSGHRPPLATTEAASVRTPYDRSSNDVAMRRIARAVRRGLRLRQRTVQGTRRSTAQSGSERPWAARREIDTLREFAGRRRRS